MDITKVPEFDDLPEVKDMPQGCAWGVFDKDGKKDLLGTLNLLTPDVIKSAYSEARDGVSVSLKLVWRTRSQLKITWPRLLTRFPQLAIECHGFPYARENSAHS